MYDEEMICKIFDEADTFLAEETEKILPLRCKREKSGKIIYYSGINSSEKTRWSETPKSVYDKMCAEKELHNIRKKKLFVVGKIKEKLSPLFCEYISLCKYESECQKSIADINVCCSDQGSDGGDNHDEYITLLGETVRSKSEQSIADSLTRAGIPYEYEPSMFDDRIHPDFVIRNSILGRTVIWEHFGLMNDSDYVYNFLSKKNFYKRNGFFEGYNFIATFEYFDPVSGKAVTFSAREAEKVVKEWFLP